MNVFVRAVLKMYLLTVAMDTFLIELSDMCAQ